MTGTKRSAPAGRRSPIPGPMRGLSLNAWPPGRMWRRVPRCLPRCLWATVHLSSPWTATSKPDGGAGAGPEQWIELDLGQEFELVCLRLLTDQFPAGRTIHRINGGVHDDPGAELGVIDSETDYGEWLELAGIWNSRFLRITTVDSPSWVAWLEIEAWGEPTGH